MNTVIFCAAALISLSAYVRLQDAPRAGQPIVLEWADSLVGTGGPGVGLREFIGHVRFNQGNVTVTCNRALQNPVANTVDLFGNVVVKQDSLTLTAQQARYDGNSRLASAQGGLTIIDGNRTITAVNGTYSTAIRMADFDSAVTFTDDTILVWSNRARYNRITGGTNAWGNVVAWDTIGMSRIRCDSLVHLPARSFFRLMGDAAVWDWDANRADTLLMIADTIVRTGNQTDSTLAFGDASVIGGNVAGRADTIQYNSGSDTIFLFNDPVVWADSTEFLADSINLHIPQRKLERITGNRNAILISRQDTTHPNRYDQIAGVTMIIQVVRDSIRQITAIHNARSITYRMEDGHGEGLANFTSDTIKALFDEGALVDVFWLGGIEGEHQPEHLVAGREANYLLPNFEWRNDRPIMQPLPQPRGSKPLRIPKRPKAVPGENADPEKKS